MVISDLNTETLFTLQDLELAWERVNASVGADTKDYFGITVYSTDVGKYLKELHSELLCDKYAPTRTFKYFEPKQSGTQRTKTVLRIKDAIVYQAIADKIAFELYGHLSKNSNYVYGSVLNENVTKGSSLLEEDEPDFYFFEYYVSLYNRFIEGISDALDSECVQWKLETDITGFFDCIPHATLILELHKLGINKAILDLLAECLNSWSGTRDMPTFNVGIPQGPPASFLLANILLDGLDTLVIERGLTYFRFMDDIRIYGENEKVLLSTLALIDRYLKGRSLSLNNSKTLIQPISDSMDDEDSLLDGSGIQIEKDSLATLSEDIVIQDQTQLKQTESGTTKLPDSVAQLAYFQVLDEIEQELLEFYQSHDSCSILEPITTKNVRRFLTLSQKWRLIVKAIKSIQEYSPSHELIKVWLFGIRHIFWKANSMVWNLKCYESLENYYSDFEDILQEFKHFEWVQYQVLNIYSKVLGGNTDRQEKAIRDLVDEASPLIRLGYYSILVEAIKTDSKLFESLSNLLKRENEEYVKDSVLNLIRLEHLNVPISSLKSWFL
ncbi:RNA-directed DNA polymerase [Methylophaga nitratireducenticrescens]|uniref:RNA-directed DNA polymerase n=1 Tax=Methylophaga nitratireducenticrescens TaxID=754476 RepID=UPI00146BC341|nr:RNA-directed DNA polymerase [Methylophaga nitratireducenticrescens]